MGKFTLNISRSMVYRIGMISQVQYVDQKLHYQEFSVFQKTTNIWTNHSNFAVLLRPYKGDSDLSYTAKLQYKGKAVCFKRGSIRKKNAYEVEEE